MMMMVVVLVVIVDEEEEKVRSITDQKVHENNSHQYDKRVEEHKRLAAEWVERALLPFLRCVQRLYERGLVFELSDHHDQHLAYGKRKVPKGFLGAKNTRRSYSNFRILQKTDTIRHDPLEGTSVIIGPKCNKSPKCNNIWS